LTDEDEERRHPWLRALVALVLLGGAALLVSRNWDELRQRVVNSAASVTHTESLDTSVATPEVPSDAQALPPTGEGTASSAAAGAAGTAEAQGRSPATQGEQPRMQVEAQPEAQATEDTKSGEVAASGAAGEGARQASSSEQAPGAEPGSTKEDQAATPAQTATAGKQASVKTRAAAQREAPAGQALVTAGERYLYGRGVARDCNQALVYFREGAELRNAQALSRLGTMYATGVCVSQDRVVAYNWFSRALAEDRSNQAIEQNLNMLWRDMSAGERQKVLQPQGR
jgi:hypothetical protein